MAPCEQDSKNQWGGEFYADLVTVFPVVFRNPSKRLLVVAFPVLAAEAFLTGLWSRIRDPPGAKIICLSGSKNNIGSGSKLI